MLNTDEPWKDLGCDHLLPRPPKKMPGSLGAVRVKNHCVGLRPAPPLEARVTPAS